jgi:sec-independent protein translocase protein TatC
VSPQLKPIGHEDRLSLVEHLDELRTRILLCLAAFAVCFAVCLWQNDAILDALNEPINQTNYKQCNTSQDTFEQQACFNIELRALALENAEYFRERSPALAERWDTLARAVPKASPRLPVTLGVGEPFFQTVRVAAYAALLLALPFLLYQIYAFVLPAFSPREKQVAVPLMSMIPFLFIAGAAFGYFVVLPNAIKFLVNFNDDSFDILLQAKDFYRFELMVLIAMGLLFQIPTGILALTRAGIVSVAQLRNNRRYAILVIAVLAMLLPGTDPVTMLLAMTPLIVLYEGSILLAGLLERRAARADDSTHAL